MNNLISSEGISRRKFFHSVTGSAGALSLAAVSGCATGVRPGSSVAAGCFREDVRDVPLRRGDDVIVCGAGLV